MREKTRSLHIINAPDAAVCAASVAAEECPRPGWALVARPLALRPAPRPGDNIGEHRAVSRLGHQGAQGERLSVPVLMVTIVQSRGEHAGVHGLGHQLRVAVDQVLAIQSGRELHLISGGRRHAHLLSGGGGVGPGPGGARATPTSRVAPGQT